VGNDKTNTQIEGQIPDCVTLPEAFQTGAEMLHSGVSLPADSLGRTGRPLGAISRRYLLQQKSAISPRINTR
jgi:hypothetical protein